MSVYDRIKTKLELLRERDKELTIFASNRHKYQLGPPLTESQISEFESRHEIRLPEDFRGFLLEVGRGGAGPYYGIYDFLSIALRSNYTSYLANPSQLTKAVGLVYERTGKNFMMREDRDQFWLLQNTDNVFREKFESCMAQFKTFDLRLGSIPISDYGCGMEFILVITGENHGTIWIDDTVGGYGISPLGVDFITWYENWLNISLKRVEIPRSERKVWGYFEYGDTAKVDFKQS